MSIEYLSKELKSDLEQWNDEEIHRRKKLVATMQEEVQIVPNPPAPKTFILRLLINKIPLLSGFLQSLGGTGSSITALLNVRGNTAQALQGASAGFQYADLVLTTINFFRIPLIYFFSFIAGEKPPITLSKNARWAYSALLLGLTLTAIIVPVTAPPIALVMASLSLILSLVSMGNLIYKRYKIQKSLQKTNEDIETKEAILGDIRNEAQKLESQLAILDKSEEGYQKKVIEVCKKIDAMEQLYLKTKNDLQGFYDKKLMDEQTLSGLGVIAYMDKGVTIVLSSLVVIGMVLSVFFPPVGLGIVAASAGLGALYIVGRVTVPLLAPIVSSLFKKLGSSMSKVFESDESLKPANELDKSLAIGGVKGTMDNENSLKPSSTLRAMRGLFGQDAVKKLRELKDDTIEIEKLNKQLLKIIKSQNHLEALEFFKNLAIIAKAEGCQYRDLSSLWDRFPNITKILPLFEKALNDVKKGDLVLSEIESAELLALESLATILKQSEIGFLAASSTPKTTTLEDKGEEERLSLK